MQNHGQRRSTVHIAIDGPAASGKSVVGSRVASALRFPFVDTGGMYRAIAWLALHRGVAVSDSAALARLAREATVEVGPPPVGSSEFATIRIAGLDATPHLRDTDVERAVSPVSAVAEVRSVMVQLQRQAAGANIVMAGRDIGTVVLPNAELKIYLVASDLVRARRRLAERSGRGLQTTLDDVLADLRRRDRLDSERAVAPLRPAEDAIQIDTDPLTVEDVVQRILALAGERIGAGQ